MEQHLKTAPKPITKILKYLPRATSSVSFQNPQVYSPVNDKKPSEKPQKSILGVGHSPFALVYEPTSPRVSCMGQVKCKHYRNLATNKFSRTTSFTPVITYNKEEEDKEMVTKVVPVVTKSKKTSKIQSLFGSRKKTDVTDYCEWKGSKPVNLPRAPSLGMMKRFSSGRDAFVSFDWTTQVTPLDGGSDGEEIRFPSSAPVMERNQGVFDNFVRVGGVNLEARKEVNLWKRRTMAQPKPLQLHVAS